MYNIANIAAIRALTTAPDSVLFAEGYCTAADGGEGAFAYVASDTTSADNGGTIIVDAGGHRWHRECGSLPLSAKWFGAKGDGATDDTAALQSWLNVVGATGATGYLPPVASCYLISNSLALTATGAAKIEGAGWCQASGVGGQQGSVICITNPTADLLWTNVSGTLTITGIGFAASVTRTGGSFLYVQNEHHVIERCAFLNYFFGIDAAANVGTIRSCTFASNVAGNVGININNYAGGLVIDDVLFYDASPIVAMAGILINTCGAVIVSNSNIIGQGADLFINAVGSGVASVFCNNTFFDTATHGIVIAANAAANVLRVKFDGCWFSSHSGDGCSIVNYGSGVISSVHFADCYGILNGGSGISVNRPGSGAVEDIGVTGGLFAANAYGIYLSGVTGASVTGAVVGSTGTLHGNSAWGIAVDGGCSNYVVTGNRMAGNGAGEIANGGHNCVVANNL